MFADKINSLGKEPLKKLLKTIGGWPMLEGREWNEADWEWDKAMNAIKDTYRIKEPADSADIAENIIDTGDEGLSSDKIEAGIKYFKQFIREIVGLLRGGEQVEKENLIQEINDLMDFEMKLDTYSRRHRKFRKNKLFKAPKEFKDANKKIIWMHLFSGFILSNTTEFEGEVDETIIDEFFLFLKQTPKR